MKYQTLETLARRVAVEPPAFKWICLAGVVDSSVEFCSIQEMK
jgi:hypothetical protein